MLELLRKIRQRRRLSSASSEEIKQAHELGVESQLIHGMVGSQYVGDFVFGGIDGVVTTFAVVAGVAGANLPAAVVLVLGMANLLADGFAMGIGNFLSIRSEHERYHQEWQREAWEVDNLPEYEREEIAAIYRAKGLSGETLEQTVKAITSDRKRWIEEMMYEELGLTPDTRSPLRGGLVTYLAFILIGFIPLLSFVVALATPVVRSYTFPTSIALTAVALFIIGALKSLVTARTWWRAGTETLLMGGLAAIVAYLVGFLLRDLAL